MNRDKYQEVATQNLCEGAKENPKKYAAMNLVEEIGEIAAEIRKSFFKGNYHQKPLNSEDLTSELGDAYWNIALLARTYGFSLQEIGKEIEIEKLNEALDMKDYLVARTIEINTYLGDISRNILQEQYQGKAMDINYMKSNLSSIHGVIEDLGKVQGIGMDDIITTNLEKIEKRYGKKVEEESYEIG